MKTDIIHYNKYVFIVAKCVIIWQELFKFSAIKILKLNLIYRF